MELIWNFYCYSFLGFVLEVLYARGTHAKKRDRKCLFFLPLCPVYGLGATAILLLPPFILSRPLLLFPASALIASGVEYLTALFYEKAWGTAFWDYSELKGNLQGRICVPFSLVWGFLGLFLVYVVQPFLARFLGLIPGFLALPALILFLLDTWLTGYVLRSTGTTDALAWYRV